MSGYLDLSFKVAATLAAQRGVALTGTANTVGYPEGASRIPIGITLDTVNDVNEAIPVRCAGIAKLQFASSVAAGALVAVDTSGLGAAFSTPNTTVGLSIPAGYLGFLIGGAASTNSVLDVYIMPGSSR